MLQTHTMIGPPSDWGILLRTFQFLFYEIQREFEEFTSVVSISMVEIYNEKVIDLLNPVASSLDENLELKTKKNGQIMVENLSEHRILHVDQIKLLFQQATGKRKMASNNVNEHSSRSHLILMTQVCSNNTHFSCVIFETKRTLVCMCVCVCHLPFLSAFE